jgi:hypothetical protein
MSVRYLTDFLIEPSPILLKLYKYSIEKINSVKTNTLSKHQSETLMKSLNNNDEKYSFRKSSWIFEYLRDTAIICM